MNYNLKYIVALVIFVLAVIVVSINTYLYYQHGKNQIISLSKEHNLLIGKRLVRDIEHKQLHDEKAFYKLSKKISGYTLEHLNIARIYDENSDLTYKSLPTKAKYDFSHNDKKFIEKVKNEKASHVHFHDDILVMDIILPLAMPLKKDEIYAESYGALYLEFDLSDRYTELYENIIEYSIIYAVVVLSLIPLLLISMNFLILRRLDKLYSMTKEISKSNYSVRVDSSFNDEIGRINSAFNEMAQKISDHKEELEIKVEEAVEKNAQQSHIIMQQNRLISMGEMINNIAHQWRQPLNTLGLILQKFTLLHSRNMLSKEKIEDAVKRGMSQVEKMSSTIDDFRDFFKIDKEVQTFFIYELVAEIELFLDSVFVENRIELITKIDQTTQISTYKNELIQVLINLINNAKDALIENRENNREILVACSIENETMTLSISDNAGGIPEEIIDSVFDPYFTTKDEGKGTGIGLYMSKTIIEENMKGTLNVHNSEKGAVFSINLSLSHIHPFCIAV